MAFWANALCDVQVHGDYAKEDVGVKMDRPAEGDEAMGGQEVAAAEWLVSLFMSSMSWC